MTAPLNSLLAVPQFPHGNPATRRARQTLGTDMPDRASATGSPDPGPPAGPPPGVSDSGARAHRLPETPRHRPRRPRRARRCSAGCPGPGCPYRRCRARPGCSDGAVVPIKQRRDRTQRLARLPAIPHQRRLVVGLIGPLPTLHLQHFCCLRSLQCVASTDEPTVERAIAH